MSFTDDIYRSIINNAPLVAGLAVAVYWLFPKMFKQSLSNGGGEIIRKIIANENLKQTIENDRKMVLAVEINDQKLKAAIAEHEKVEEEKLAAALKFATQDAHSVADRLIVELKATETRAESLERAVGSIDARVGHIEAELIKVNGAVVKA